MTTVHSLTYQSFIIYRTKPMKKRRLFVQMHANCRSLGPVRHHVILKIQYVCKNTLTVHWKVPCGTDRENLIFILPRGHEWTQHKEWMSAQIEIYERKWDIIATWWSVLPPGSSPLPGPVTSQFYRIGRPRPGRVYTSQRTAAWVSFPSWQAGIRQEDGGTEIQTGPPLSPAGTSRVLFSYRLLQWVRQGKRQHAQQ